MSSASYERGVAPAADSGDRRPRLDQIRAVLDDALVALRAISQPPALARAVEPHVTAALGHVYAGLSASSDRAAHLGAVKGAGEAARAALTALQNEASSAGGA